MGSMHELTATPSLPGEGAQIYYLWTCHPGYFCTAETHMVCWTVCMAWRTPPVLQLLSNPIFAAACGIKEQREELKQTNMKTYTANPALYFA